MRVIRRGATLAVAISLVVALASCGGADNNYVENADDSLFLRLPGQWISYDEQQMYDEPLTTAGDALSTLDVLREMGTNWVVGFGAEELTSPTDALAFASNVPVGYAAVVQLDPVARETFDIVAQRSFGWPPLQVGGLLDPVAAFRDNPSGPVEVFSYEEFEVPGRGHGTRVRAGFDGIGDDSVVRDVTVVSDTVSTELYVLSVGCYAQCFISNADEINDVVSSFTLEDAG